MSERLIPKNEWGEGPWQQEADRYHWVDEATGLDCLMVRNPMFGNWCGYCGIPERHPLYEKGYSGRIPVPDRSQVPIPENASPIAVLSEAMKEDDGCVALDVLIDVHGGLTFAGPCEGSICHTHEEAANEPVWWFGFDMGHAGDFQPALMVSLREGLGRPSYLESMGEYRDESYVREQVTGLAQQLGTWNESHRTDAAAT